MSRLTKEQAIKYYGQNLPTPTIDRITLTNITHTDEIYTELSQKTVRDAAPRKPRMLLLALVLRAPLQAWSTFLSLLKSL